MIEVGHMHPGWPLFYAKRATKSLDFVPSAITEKQDCVNEVADSGTDDVPRK